MSSDKKISQLTPYPLITGNELSVLSDGVTDYQFTFSVLLQYLSNNIGNRLNTTFGTTLPQNYEGENGDIFINTASNTFAQKVNGVWIVKYQQQVNATQTKFGFGAPANSNGINDDVYVDTSTGIFYKKSNEMWMQVFSMQTGPAGPPGTKGNTGADGINGNTILSGGNDPSNLSDGKDGDYYINTSTWKIFGPKTNHAWPAGLQIVQTLADGLVIPMNSLKLSTPSETTLRLTWDTDLKNQFGPGKRPVMFLRCDSMNGTYKWDTSVQPKYNKDAQGNIASIDFETLLTDYYELNII
ncbi:hypothetical protein [Mucilaginibacter ginkgonis]|uniref:Collagen triple helix repeat protein n=1 Tax=Mucilaginibacter ginkgonis TaxID=2682091 RepID=A0A6I4IMH3_9SPHI|nr:hypothetical protein [Mucilaginibacter ginkgonis]QQL50329.1 hypothetical protein GO620_002420 [Mucilaginibacter ginkgonis]